MTQKLTIFLSFFLMMVPVLSNATSPESLELKYDQLVGTLSAQGHHPTQDRFEHYIRRLIVVRNQEEPMKFFVTRQDSVSEFKITVPLKLEPGDKIHVDVYCSQGGMKAADLEIPKIVQKVQPTEITAKALKAIKDKDHQNSMIIP